MRFPALWTAVMATALAVLCSACVAMTFGGSVLAWALSPLGMFLALNVILIAVILVFELLDRCRIKFRSWRPLVHEVFIVAILLGWGALLFTSPITYGAAIFFATMYLLRATFFRLWQPGDPIELP